MKTLILGFVLAGFWSSVTCQAPSDPNDPHQPCAGHVECARKTQEAYTLANKNEKLECQALYDGLVCMENTNCPKAQTAGLQQAIDFARKELNDIKCTGGPLSSPGGGGTGGNGTRPNLSIAAICVAVLTVASAISLRS